MQFVDQVLIRVRAGTGGRGIVAFRREKFVPMGGPSGGDGGDGGSVVVVVDEGLSTLLDFRYRREYEAKSGEHGSNKDKYGRSAEDLVLRVPPGTQIHDQVTGALLADLSKHEERFLLARGGKGGRGNIHFTTSTDRAPRRAEPGWHGEERDVRLDLKLLADVGLLGFPNVGKSSLIARISAARPKIADYPFTTLVPNLGMVRLRGERSFVVADIPGLIEGAHEGAGLGGRFLRHLERTRVLVHLLDASAIEPRAPMKDFDAINRELALFDAALAKRPQLVVLNKADLPDVEEAREALTAAFARRKIRLLVISAATGAGLDALLEEIWKVIAAERKKSSTGAATGSTTGSTTGSDGELAEAAGGSGAIVSTGLKPAEATPDAPGRAASAKGSPKTIKVPPAKLTQKPTKKPITKLIKKPITKATTKLKTRPKTKPTKKPKPTTTRGATKPARPREH
jgi:GTP-binding protein